MTIQHWNVITIYFVFILVATLLALLRRTIKKHTSGESLWKKYPTYILINLLFIVVCWLPFEWQFLTTLLALLGALASWEISRALAPSGKTSLFPVATCALIGLAGFFNIENWLNIWLILLFATIAFTTFTVQPADYARIALIIAACLVYLPLCLVAYLWISKIDPSGFKAVFLYLVIATNDAFAQISGELFGKRQLTSRISPSKTVEGALGGILFATVMGIALAESAGFNLLIGLLSGCVLGLAGLTGDLTASLWKRALGIKNYSTLLGAQGGVLDRFDSLIFSAPVFYLLLNFVS